MRLSLPRQTRVQTLSGERRRSGGLLRVVLVVLLLAWAVRVFVIAPFSIPSGSMLPTLFVGDYVVAAKWPYGYSRYSFPWGVPSFQGRVFAGLPERGDVVVFRAPGTADDYVKRVIGLPGDRIEVRDGVPVVNGESAERRPADAVSVAMSPNSLCGAFRVRATPASCEYPRSIEVLPGGRSYSIIDQVAGSAADWMPAVTVPEGHLFVMGDNRDDSLDSRFSLAEGGVGMVPLENLVGRGSRIIWSTDGNAEYSKPWTWFSALRTKRLGRGVDESEQ